MHVLGTVVIVAFVQIENRQSRSRSETRARMQS